MQLVRSADRLGPDLAGLQDHPYLPEHLDMWTLLVDLAARTGRIRVFPDVASLPLRSPAVLAKAAASLDLMSGGRVDLGLGAGGSWDGIAAMGGPRRTPGEAVAALGEAIDVVRAFWSGERAVRAGGGTYALSGVHPGPVPGRRIEIWIGALDPRMLDLTGRSADGWLPSSAYVPPADLVLTEGLDTFVLWPHEDVEQQLHRFAKEVVPAVRRYGTARGLLADRVRAAGRPMHREETELLADEVVTAVDGIATYGLADPTRYTPGRQRALVARVLTRVGLDQHAGEPRTAREHDDGRHA